MAHRITEIKHSTMVVIDNPNRIQFKSEPNPIKSHAFAEIHQNDNGIYVMDRNCHGLFYNINSEPIRIAKDHGCCNGQIAKS